MGPASAGTFRAVLFPGGTTAAGQSQYFDCSHLGPLTVYVTGFGTISTGTLLLEEADWDKDKDPAYQGTWSQIQSIDLTASTGGGNLGNTTAYHVPASAPGTYAWGYIRGRISVAVTGASGAVKIVLRGRP